MKNQMAMPTDPESPMDGEKDIMDHEVESALSDVMSAHKHKSNPQMMAKMHALAKQKKMALDSLGGEKPRRAQSIQDLKDMVQAKHKK